MSRRTWTTISAGTLVVSVTALVFFNQVQAGRDGITIPVSKQAPPTVSAFDSKLWSIHLEMSAKEYEAIQPPIPGGFGGPGGPPPKKQGNAPESRERDTNRFGTAFPWGEAAVTVDGKSFEKVGLRYSGEITYLASAQKLKRPWKIAFDRFGGPAFHGIRSVQLHSMAMDPSNCREFLAASVFQQAGVPSRRVVFAEVKLSVPGKYDRELLGLYTVVEEVDSTFLTERFGDGTGLLMQPFGLKGIDSLGDDWSRYAATYGPQRQATKAEQKRLIDFASLVNRGSNVDFAKEIGSYLDVDAFLRFLAANAISSNLESYFAIGHNYSLYLVPKTNTFAFIPGDLEFSFANFLLMGTAEQLMDLSVMKPYPGENRLADRILGIPQYRDQYTRILKELTAKGILKDPLIQQIEAVDRATKGIRAQEAKSLSARKEPQGGFGAPGAFAPKPPELKTFAEKRTASIEAQLAGRKAGYQPQLLTFGPPPGGGGGPPGGGAQPKAIDETIFAKEVKAPPGFDVRLFAAPPKVNSPVAISCEPSGAIYVAVDEQGSLGRTPGGGRIVRIVDRDLDGKADSSTVFCKVEHPRGVAYRAGKVWVCHPPDLSVFTDTNGDGIADTNELLVTGLTTNQIADRGGDHTTNGIRIGIDGWLYIGVGDYGIKLAKGKDGRTISLRGGGVVRVRPDGTELEIYCTGLRNPFDLAIDPFMNIFTRDNTNDGAGWDTRVSLLRQSALYGYTQLFANFTDEIMPTLGTFGNGGGTGAVYIDDPRWPQPFRSNLLTGDWGRSELYLHTLKPNGASFDLDQKVYLTLPRATGMDLDADGNLYAASWRGGEASVFVGPNVGFVTRITPKGLRAEAFPVLKTATITKLLELLGGPGHVTRFHAQGEILARGRNAELTAALVSLASKTDATPEARAAAIWTLKQLDGIDSHPKLVELAKNPQAREAALRALTDRKSALQGLDPQLFVASLADESPRIRAQAGISLARLGDVSVAKSLIPYTVRTDGSKMPTQKPVQNQPDPGRVVPHLAVRALVSLNAIEACLEALDGPYSKGALWVLRDMHQNRVVDGLIRKLASVRDTDLRRGILATLIRLHDREADYTGSWWGIRPDNRGPYYERVEWSMTSRIRGVLTAAIQDADKDTLAFLKAELARHTVSLPGAQLAAEASNVDDKPLILPKADPKNPDQLGNLSYAAALQRTLTVKGDPARGKRLFESQSCVACHTTADGQSPKGPHLVDIGKRSKTEELIESILKPSEKLAQGYEMYRFEMADGRAISGFVVSERADRTVIREANGVMRELKKTDIETRQIQKTSAMPDGLAANLLPAQLADLLAYLQSLK